MIGQKLYSKNQDMKGKWSTIPKQSMMKTMRSVSLLEKQKNNSIDTISQNNPQTVSNWQVSFPRIEAPTEKCSIPSIPTNNRKYGYYETLDGSLFPLVEANNNNIQEGKIGPCSYNPQSFPKRIFRGTDWHSSKVNRDLFGFNSRRSESQERIQRPGEDKKSLLVGRNNSISCACVFTSSVPRLAYLEDSQKSSKVLPGPGHYVSQNKWSSPRPRLMKKEQQQKMHRHYVFNVKKTQDFLGPGSYDIQIDSPRHRINMVPFSSRQPRFFSPNHSNSSSLVDVNNQMYNYQKGKVIIIIIS